jgi:hypothetical protein
VLAAVGAAVISAGPVTLSTTLSFIVHCLKRGAKLGTVPTVPAGARSTILPYYRWFASGQKPLQTLSAAPEWEGAPAKSGCGYNISVLENVALSFVTFPAANGIQWSA